MPNYPALKAELAKPDLSALDNTAAAAKLNSDVVTTTEERSVVPAYEVWEAIVPGEWSALTAAEKQRVQTIVSMGDVNLRGTNTRNALAAAFGAATTTRGNLVALQTLTRSVSRAESIPGWGLPATEHDVARARSMTT